jgi:integrase
MAQAKRKKRERLSYITGERGKNRVTLYVDSRRSGALRLEYRDEDGKKRLVTLPHADFERGKIAAHELAAKLLAAPTRKQVESGPLTLRTLFDRYERGVTPNKKASTQAHDRRTMSLFTKCWGSNAVVEKLDRTDWDRFIKQRQSGALTGGRKIRNRQVEYDLRFLLAVCNWAMTVRDTNGSKVLDSNPFKGFPVPVENNVRRPVVTDAEYDRLARAAATLAATAKAPTRKGKENGKRPWRDVELYLLLAHETGHRCSAIGRLRWSDVDLEHGLITWRAENDKKGFEHTVPVTAKALDALKAARIAELRIGDGWVFPSPTDASKSVRRDVLRDAWEKLEKIAGLERIPGRGWHSLRRKFATSRQDLPLKGLCVAGGWKDHNTVLKCYIQPDVEQLRAIVERTAVAV